MIPIENTEMYKILFNNTQTSDETYYEAYVAYRKRGMGEDDMLVGFVRYTSDMDALLYALDPEDEHLMKIVDLDKDDVLYREYYIKKVIIEYPLEGTAAS